MSKVAVWMPVYNEQQHLRSALHSIVEQDYEDFTLYVSDNHSTDGSRVLIEEFAAQYPLVPIIILQPPRHLPGIEHMKFMWDHLCSQGAHAYSIHIGGHDLWPPQHLQILVERMDREIAALATLGRTVALTYTDTWQIDDDGFVVEGLEDVLQIGQMSRAVIPQFVIAGVRSSHLFGIWNETVRRKIPVRHCCAGWDHLVVAEAALRGAIRFEGTTVLKMRASQPDYSLQKYGKRHLSEDVLAAGTLDFRHQLEWCVYLVDEALRAMPEAVRPVNRILLTASMVTMYLSLRGYNLSIVPGAAELLNDDPMIRQILAATERIDEQVRLWIPRGP